MQGFDSSSSAFDSFGMPMYLQRPWLRHAKRPFMSRQPRQRAHPDLNQGPADLQSAALTTELCTRMPGWFPACWLQGRRVVFFLHWLEISLHAYARFYTLPTLESQGPGAHCALRARVPSILIKRKQRPMYPPTKRVFKNIFVFFCFYIITQTMWFR